MRSLGILDRKDNEPTLVQITDEEIVSQMIEPFASPTRFQIIQAVSKQTKTFSELSHLTRLRGGNLLFHVRKLQQAGMIIQRHERGDYIITERGFRILTSFIDTYTAVKRMDER